MTLVEAFIDGSANKIFAVKLFCKETKHVIFDWDCSAQSLDSLHG